MDGFATNILFWTTRRGSTGHAAIAVDEYDDKGNKTGYVNVFEKFPQNAVGFLNATKDVPAEATSGRIKFSDLDHYHNRPAGGIIQLDTDQKTDGQIESKLKKQTNDNKDYNSLKSNCTDFVCGGLEAGNIKVDSEETVKEEKIIPGPNSITIVPAVKVDSPNQPFRNAATLPNATIIRDPGEKVNTTVKEFLDDQKRAIKKK